MHHHEMCVHSWPICGMAEGILGEFFLVYIKVGFDAGDGENYFSVPGSMTDRMRNLPRMSNIDIPGQFVFRVDQKETGI